MFMLFRLKSQGKSPEVKKMNWKSEGLALAFGTLIILLVIGDATQIS
jgi:hypothetical protein